MSKNYRGSGSASSHPAVLLSLLVSGCAAGVFSSRQLERATCDSVTFRFIAGNDHPDHDTIATYRRRFLKEIEAQLKAEVADLLAKAEAADQADVPGAMSIAEELERASFLKLLPN
jgi:hypothetical protein